MIQGELSHAIEENKQVIAHFENEVSLRQQQIDALERYLGETKDTLDRQQHTHSIQIEQLQLKLNVERKELTEKVDTLTAEITRKERLCTNLENAKDALTQQVA